MQDSAVDPRAHLTSHTRRARNGESKRCDRQRSAATRTPLSESVSKGSVAGDAARYEHHHGDRDHGLDGRRKALEVLGEAAVDCDPREGALDDPALRLNDEARVGTPDDLDGARRNRGDPRPLVSRVGKEALDERKAGGDAVEYESGVVAILYARGVHLDAHHQGPACRRADDACGP